MKIKELMAILENMNPELEVVAVRGETYSEFNEVVNGSCYPTVSKTGAWVEAEMLALREKMLTETGQGAFASLMREKSFPAVALTLTLASPLR